MAQLRDAQTSAFIADGPRLELALIADAIGRDRVLFDDVGTFDLDEELSAHAAYLAAVRAELDRTDGRERRAPLEHELAVREQLVADALARVDEIRAALAAIHA